jgi:hypothetical protein
LLQLVQAAAPGQAAHEAQAFMHEIRQALDA